MIPVQLLSHLSICIVGPPVLPTLYENMKKEFTIQDHAIWLKQCHLSDAPQIYLNRLLPLDLMKNRSRDASESDGSMRKPPRQNRMELILLA